MEALPGSHLNEEVTTPLLLKLGGMNSLAEGASRRASFGRDVFFCILEVENPGSTDQRLSDARHCVLSWERGRLARNVNWCPQDTGSACRVFAIPGTPRGEWLYEEKEIA